MRWGARGHRPGVRYRRSAATTGAATIEAATTEAAATNDLPGATGATRATRAFRVRGPRSTRTRLLALHPFRAGRAA